MARIKCRFFEQMSTNAKTLRFTCTKDKKINDIKYFRGHKSESDEKTTSHYVQIHVTIIKLCDTELLSFNGSPISKALTCMKIYGTNKKGKFVKETDTFAYFVV